MRSDRAGKRIPVTDRRSKDRMSGIDGFDGL